MTDYRQTGYAAQPSLAQDEAGNIWEVDAR